MEWNEIITASVVGVDCDAVGYNPIKKVPVVVTGDQGCVNIDIVPTLDEAGNVIEGIGDGGAGGRGVGGMASTTAGLTAQLLAVQSLASQIRRELQEMRANQMADRVATHKSFIVVNANIRRIALQPGMRGPVGTLRRQGNDDARTDDAALLLATAGVNAAPASLSPNPKNLFELWHEFLVGLGGRKPARLFSAKERGGKMKHKYHRRNVIWKMVSGLVHTGMTADAAIDSIYAVYGQQTCVTDVINGIKRDMKGGMLNPNLRV
jgi:Transcriptional activator of glycolytic enzymes